MDQTINISVDFSDAPGARFYEDGEKSGQEFYDLLLEPKFLLAKEAKTKLIIDLDNTWGYASSFISGSFGELSINHGADVVLGILQFISNDDPLMVKKIEDEIRNPKSKPKAK